jgi:xylulokinase
MQYIGLDVGTSGCKAALVDGHGIIHAASRREYSFETDGDHIELNPVLVWEAVLEVLSDIGPHAKDAAALACSSIGESLVILDREDRVLANGIVYLDNRSAGMMARIEEKIQKRELFDITGLAFNQMFSLSRILWQKQFTPQALEKADKIFLFGDFIAYKLSGERAIDPESASRTMLFDYRKNEWSEVLMGLFDVPVEKFSPVTPAGTIIGGLLPEIARKTGLGRGLKICAGCHDQCSATLGAGVFGKGQMMLGEGSSESINAIMEFQDIDNDTLFEKQLSIEPFVNPGEYMVCLGMLQHGTSIKWFVNNNKSYYDSLPSNEGESIYSKADRFSAKSSGELYFIPYLTRSCIMDASSRALGCFIGLEYKSDINTMYRALLEGLAFESKSNMEALTETGYRPQRFVATGGGANSPLFMQIKADILGSVVEIPVSTDSGIMGLAMICSVALGEYNNYAEAAGCFIQTKDRYAPQTDYRKRAETYAKINKTIKALYRDQAVWRKLFENTACSISSQAY